MVDEANDIIDKHMVAWGGPRSIWLRSTSQHLTLRFVAEINPIAIDL